MKSLILYLSVFMIVFIINSIGSKYYKNHKVFSSILILISFMILILLIGVRDGVGTDYDSYIYYYNLISNLSFDELSVIDWEYGALIIFKLTSLIFQNEKFIMIVLAFLTIYPLYKANKLYDYKYLPYSILTYCLIFLPFSMNGMRQAIAMSFTLLATIYLIKDNKIKSILSIVIAFLFHKSAIIIVPYLILFMIKKGKKIERDYILITLILSIFILFFNEFLINLGFISEYDYYLTDINIENISLNNFIFYIPFILIMVSFSNNQENNLNMLKGFVISGIILEVIGTSKQYLSRIALYYSMAEIILIPILLKHISNQTTKKLVSFLYIIFLITYFVYQFYIIGRHEIFPYQTWLIGGNL